MRNKYCLFLMVLLLALIFLPGISAVAYTAPHLTVTLVSQDPDPVEPGQVVTVKFKIENDGTESSNAAIVKVLPEYPFTLYGDDAEKNIGKLRASSTGADAEVVEFKLKVDEQAVEADTALDLTVQIGETTYSYTDKEFLVRIRTQDAVLAITSITSEPAVISPGETAKVIVMIKNTADSLLKNIKFKLEMASSSIPLAPYQSSSERVISQLLSHYQQTMTFNLIALPDATSGLYKVPLNISYNDEQGTSYHLTDTLAVLVGEKPKVNVYVKKSTVLQADNGGKITLEVANAGNTDLKFMELTLLPSDDYKLITTHNYFYLGNIASDDTQSEEIEIYVNKEAKKAGKVNLPVQLKYVDANNQQYQQAFGLEFKVFSSSDLRQFGLMASSSAGAYVLIIILILLGIFLYRSYRKNPLEFVKKWKARLSFGKFK